MQNNPIPIALLAAYRLEQGRPKLYLQRRKSKDQFNDFLELPGGKIEKGETPLTACVRETKEEVGIEISESELQLFGHRRYDYPDKSLLFFICTYQDQAKLFGADNFFHMSELEHYCQEIPPANLEFLKDIDDGLTHYHYEKHDSEL